MRHRVKIVTVDPAKRNIEAMLKEGSAIQLQIWDIPPLFRWPRQGEFWTVERIGNFWTLGTLLEHPESDVRIEQLAAGEALIAADTIRTEAGGYVVTSNLPAAQTETFETGDIKLAGYTTPDPEWLTCDGAAYSRTSYANLFARIQTAHGVGDGSTTFNVPNLLSARPSAAFAYFIKT